MGAPVSNLLTEPLISVAPNRRVTLPGLFAAMSRGTVSGFPALRAHQRAAWHMFLVQLAVLALDHRKHMEIPDAVEDWAGLLRALTPDFADDAPWCLWVPDRTRPGFLQPPDPGGLKWTEVETPDALDMLITSKNHDLKAALARDPAPEDWLFALVSLQTSEGYNGAGNHGIARMNGGASSRPMLALAPLDAVTLAPNPSAWWARDVARLLSLRAEGQVQGVGKEGGHALLWCLPWPEGRQLSPLDCDPCFLEVCRRVRLTAIGAERATSKAARMDAKQFNGVLGDPWTPVHIAEAKSLTLGEGNFTYKRVFDLLYSGNWALPALAQPGPDDTQDMALVAEALSRGNSKTDGLKTRVIKVPRRVVRVAFGTQVQDVAKTLLGKIELVDGVLKTAVAVLAASGDGEKLKRGHYDRARPARQDFDKRVDELFFPALWAQLEAGGMPERDAASTQFERDLVAAARTAFDAAKPAIPVPALWRHRANARAEQAFRRGLAKHGLSETTEPSHDAA